MTLPARFLPLALIVAASSALADPPIALHPENPHYFQSRGSVPSSGETSAQHVRNRRFEGR